MSSTTSGTAFAMANAAMVRGTDGASTVHVLLADCLELLDASSAGVLVSVGGQDVELLAATSHRVEELELYQSQLHEGPCIEAIERGEPVEASGRLELAARWPVFGRAMASAGLLTIHASPMRWHERVLGGVNLFWRTERALSTDERDLARAFADICTLALMQPSTSDMESVSDRLRTALQGRVAIERAKGVLAETEGVDVAAAFTLLAELSKKTGRPLAEIALKILDDVAAPR